MASTEATGRPGGGLPDGRLPQVAPDGPAFEWQPPSRWWYAWQNARSLAYPGATLGSLLLLWELGVGALDVPTYLLPRPSAVLQTMVEQFPYLWSNAGTTVQEIAAGFALSVLAGVPLAVLIVSSPFFEKSLYPLLVASQTVPKVALAPLLVVWFGFGLTPKILITFLIAFFPIVVDTAVGLRGVPTEMIDLAHSMGASRTALFWKIRFMYALPNVFGGLKVGMTLAVIGAIVGEFVGASSGLGYVLQVAIGRLDTRTLFAAIFFLVAIGIVSFLLVEVVERIAIPWHVSMRKDRTLPGGTA